MDLSFKIGHRQETVSIPDANLLGVLYAHDFSPNLTGSAGWPRQIAGSAWEILNTTISPVTPEVPRP